MNAKEATKNVQDFKNNVVLKQAMEPLWEAIREASSRGETCLRAPMSFVKLVEGSSSGIEDRAEQIVYKELSDKGFKVKTFTPDARGIWERPYTEVTWPAS